MLRTALWNAWGVNKMRPLIPTSAPALLERIENAKGGELRSIIMQDPTTCLLTFSVQDKNRGYDWINVTFEISGVHDARLLEEERLKHVDMSDGVSVLFDGEACGILFGSYNRLTAHDDATMYVLGTSMKYLELPFSE